MKKEQGEHANTEKVADVDVVDAVTDPLAELQAKLAEKEAEAATNWDKFLRERADLENYRKRTQKEKEELIKYGNESLLNEFLPAVDNIERALDHIEADSNDPVIVGIRMTLDMLVAAMKKFGVTQIVSEKGSPFDPALHQAMGQMPSDLPVNSIADVFQKGYLLNERLLRPAMVMVSKGQEA